MNIAVIIAGGSGQRMGADIPKQFIKVFDKPILFYTLEGFERHPMIDMIELVCIKGWEDEVTEYAKEYNITKLKKLVPGGNTAQESIRNGLLGLTEIAKDDDLVVLHDGIRPLVDEDVLTDVINVCMAKGNAVTSLPYNEQIFVINEADASTTTKYVPRDTLRRVSTPQAYKFGKLSAAYEKAFAENIGIGPSTYANTMMVDLGETLHFAKGSDKNIKLTTKEDLEIFKGYITAKRDNI